MGRDSMRCDSTRCDPMRCDRSGGCDIEKIRRRVVVVAGLKLVKKEEFLSAG